MPGDNLKEKFMSSCYDQVKNDPTKPVPKIYNEVRNALGRDLTETEKRRFFQQIPSQRSCQANLYGYRRNFIPPAPNTYVSKINYIFSNCNSKCLEITTTH